MFCLKYCCYKYSNVESDEENDELKESSEEELIEESDDDGFLIIEEEKIKLRSGDIYQLTPVKPNLKCDNCKNFIKTDYYNKEESNICIRCMKNMN